MGFFKPEDFEGAGIPHTPTAADIANAKRDESLREAEALIRDAWHATYSEGFQLCCEEWLKKYGSENSDPEYIKQFVDAIYVREVQPNDSCPKCEESKSIRMENVKIDRLIARMKRLTEALEFYADKRSWRELDSENRPGGMRYHLRITSRDSSEVGSEEYYFYGGKIARKALEEK